MKSTRSLEKMASSIASLNRGQVKKHLRNFKGRFKLDFSDSYLDSVSLDRLKHILMAAMMTNLK